jgi:uncharacterized SAM-binding protein YcdF (DUF218 family)
MLEKQNSNKDSIKNGLKGCGCLIFGLVSILTIGVLTYASLVAIGALLIVSDPIEPVDAVVVLSGGEGDRLALALEMHQMGYARYLVITDTTPEANQQLIRDAKAGGFVEGDIILTTLQVESTVDEAIAVRELALYRAWDGVMVVTDPFHSFRTRFIFRQELRGSGIEVYVRPLEGHWFRSPTWFIHPEGWHFVFLEVVKFIYYLFFRI